MIDRALLQLTQTKLLNQVNAIIFGEFCQSGSNEYNFIQQVIKDFAKSTEIHCFISMDFGHYDNNYPLIYNTKSKITKENNKNNHYKLIMNIK